MELAAKRELNAARENSSAVRYFLASTIYLGVKPTATDSSALGYARDVFGTTRGLAASGAIRLFSVAVDNNAGCRYAI